MRPKEFDFDVADVDADGICAAQTPAGAENLTIDGALASGGAVTLDYARQLCIVSDGNDSGVTFTVTGTDADGYAQTEAITGPNATTVESTKYFKTVTAVAISAAGTGSITVGTVDEIASKTIPLNWRSVNQANIAVDVTGTLNFTVQECFEQVWQEAKDSPTSARWKPQQDANWLSISALASKTADTNSVASAGATAIRLLFNSHSSGAEAQLILNQPTNP